MEYSKDNAVASKSTETLVAELEEARKALRRLECENRFKLFVDIYLKHLATKERPVFHGVMMDKMEGVMGVIQKEGNKKKEEGRHAPTTTREDDIKAPPQIFQEKTDSLLTEKEISRLVFIAPRGFAKSTLCSVFLPLFLALYKKKTDIFIVSSTISLSKELLRKIRIELEENEKILSDFGDMKSDKWTEEMLVLKNNVVIRAKGRGFQIRGFRPDMIVCDDLEDEEVIYSKEQRDKLEEWFFRTLLPALKPDQALIYVGTNLHQFSLIGKLFKKEEFVGKKWAALTDGKSIWEDMWTTERLLAMKKEIGIYAFESEYQNNPISREEQPIKQHYLENVVIKGKRDVRCMAIDPAASVKEKSDYRAFVIMDRTEDGFKEVYSERGKWGLEEQIERVIGLYETYKPDRVVIESVAFQKVYKDVLTEKARARKIYIPVSEAELGVSTTGDKRPRDKFTRLISVSHLFEQRLVEIVNPEMKDELLSFPTGEHDDMVDACVYALYWLMNYRKGGFMVSRETRKLPLNTKESFYMKEVRPGVFMATDERPKIKLGAIRRIISFGGS